MIPCQEAVLLPIDGDIQQGEDARGGNMDIHYQIIA